MSIRSTEHRSSHPPQAVRSLFAEIMPRAKTMTDVVGRTKNVETPPVPRTRWQLSPELLREYPTIAPYVPQVMETLSDTHQNEVTVRQHLADKLTADIKHLVSEFSLWQTKTNYALRIDLTTPEASLTGDGYDDSLEVMAGSFIHNLCQRQELPDRAVVEHIVFAQLKHELRAVAEEFLQNPEDATTAWVLTSPPDEKKYGYHGIDSDNPTDHHVKEQHHTYLYLFRVKQIPSQLNPETGKSAPFEAIFEVTQYQTWHNLAQLYDLQRRLGAPVAVDPNFPAPAQLYANALAFRVPSAGELAAFQTTIETEIYRGQEQWRRRPADAPQFADHFVRSEIWQLLEKFLLPKLLALCYQMTPELMNASNTPHLRRVLEEFDHLIAHYTAFVQQYIEEKNTNPRYERLVWQKKSLADKVKLIGRKLLGGDEPLPLTHPDRLKIIEGVSQGLIDRVVHDQAPTKEQEIWLAKHAPQVMSLTGFVLGSAQCYVLAPITIPLNAVRAVEGLAQIGSIEGVIGELSRTEQHAQLTAVNDVLEVITKLEQSGYVELDLRAQGAAKVWMVPANYLDAPGCRVDQDSGRVLGPCDLFLDDPRETAARPFPVSKTELLEQQRVLTHTLHNQEMRATDDVLQQKLSGDELSEGRTMLQTISKTIMAPLVKSSISLSELISGAAPITIAARAILPGEVLRAVELSAQPLVTLQAFVDRLAITSLPQNLRPKTFETTIIYPEFGAKVPLAMAV